MAKVVVTFEDTEDGGVTVDIDFSPPAKTKQPPTRAQSYAMAVLRRAKEDADDLAAEAKKPDA